MFYPLSGYVPLMTVTEWAMPTVDNICAEMARKRKKQRELAGVLGISQAGVSRRLAGQTPLDVNELYAIAKWLDVSPAVFLVDPQNGPTIGRMLVGSHDCLVAA